MNQTKNARRALIGACVALFANMGINSTFSVFLPSFTATWGEDKMATIALSATFGCVMTFLCSTFLFGALLKKTQPRTVFLLCGVLAAVYCLLCCFAPGIWMIILAGLFGGVNLAFGTHAMGIAAITPHFGAYGAKAPTVIALVLASASVGATAFSFFPGALLALMPWRQVYLVILAVVLLCNVLAFFIIPKLDLSAAGAGEATAQTADVPGLTKKQAFRTPAFWLVFFGILFLAISYLALYKSHMMLTGNIIYIAVHLEIAMLGGKHRLRLTNHMLIVNAAVVLKILYGDKSQPVFFSQLPEAGSSQHGAVLIHHLIAYSALREPRKP